MNKKAFEEVYEDLIKCNLFCGKHDARHGSAEYMNGIKTVMEYIAYKADKTDEFDELFHNNYFDSYFKAG